MKRLAVLGSTFLMLVGLAGCGADQRAEEITKAVNFFKNAAENTRTVKNDVNKAVTDAEKANRTLTEKDFKAAEEDAKKLREVGKQLLDVKGQIDILQEKTGPQEKERLDAQFAGQLQGLFTDFEKSQKELDDALVRADKRATPAAMTELRKAINDSREEFRILTKPH